MFLHTDTYICKTQLLLTFSLFIVIIEQLEEEALVIASQVAPRFYEITTGTYNININVSVSICSTSRNNIACHLRRFKT